MALPPLATSLLRDGLITEEDLKSAASRMLETREPLLDTLADLKTPTEEKMLSFLSDKHGHPFMSIMDAIDTKPPEKLIKSVPINIAKKYQVIPIEIEGGTGTLKTVMLDPTNTEAISFLSMASNLPRVQAFQVLPSAYEGLFRRYYEGNLDVFGVASGILTTDVEWFLEKYAAMYRLAAVDKDAEAAWLAETSGGKMGSLSSREPEFMQAPGMQIVRDAASMNSMMDPDAGGQQQPPQPVHPHSPAPLEQSVLTPEPEPTNIWEAPLLVGFLRNFITAADEAHPLGAGHSVRIADRALALSKKLGVSPEVQQKIVYAGLLHDVGMGSEHYTVLNQRENIELLQRAQLNYRYLIDNFEDMPLPEEIENILIARFEHYDGTGFPEGLHDDAIPQASRILAVVDAYTDLCDNLKYPVHDAIEELQKHQGALFDPVVIAALSAAVNMATGAFSQVALIYSSDPILCAELDIISELKMQVLTANNASIARRRLANAIVRVLIIDLEDDPAGGITTATGLMHHKACENAILIFFFSKITDDLKTRIKLLPTAAVFNKSTDATTVKEKIAELMEKGVTTGNIKIKQQKGAQISYDAEEALAPSAAPPQQPAAQEQPPEPAKKDDIFKGSLQSYPLAVLMKEYFDIKVTGRLTLLQDDYSGELYFDSGNLVHAIMDDLSGEKAFTRIVRLTKAAYWFDKDTLVLETAIKRPMKQLIAYVEKVINIAKK